MTRLDSARAAILGSADGVCSVAGVITGGTGAVVGHSQLARTAFGYAVAGMVSMAGGEWLSEGKTEWGAVGAMATGAFLGAALPSLPLFFASGMTAWIAILSVALVVGVLVGEVRARTLHQSHVGAQLRTLSVLFAAGVVGYLAGRFF